ncbi:Chitinase A1 precursor [Pelotomaculum sp. FP]|uniref:fibronectin type III domain-containing protein n=1 Tax=Pelotomaculum sp. FP TaxID=261474 RepID=UPI0010647731|nr:fibronectin type III domain-containing protein [Pelotomaculum sp. FP]TEB14841.1 Chitinase A1 precursor [Pelotomaculum sp. FP]
MKNKHKPIILIAIMLCFLVAAGSIPAFAAENTVDVVSTVAGTGINGYAGDGGPAVSAQISSVYGLAVDSAGNIYIPDQYNHRVRKIDTDGNISTVAGTGNSGYSGDGGSALNADLKAPTAVAVDSSGNLYIAGYRSYRIRKVDASGNISTVVGTGSSGYAGDDGPAVNAQISSYVYGLAVDGAGNLYIADSNNYRIRKVDNNGNISTVAGTGSNGYSGDGGPAVSAEISEVYQLAVDSAGNLYFADSQNNRIRKVDTAGVISTVAGNGAGGFGGDGGPATAAQLGYPHGVTVDSAGNIYIADSNNQRIRKVDASGNISTLAGSGTYGFYDGLATAAEFFSPYGVAIDGSGKLYIADNSNYRIRLVKSVEFDPTIPSWPDRTFTVSNLTATGLTLNWNPAADDVAVTGYRIYEGTTLLTPDLVTTTTYNVSGLTQNTSYTFTVQAVDGDGHESLYGPRVSATALDATPPAWTSGSLTQTGLVADSVTLNWSVATDNQNQLKGYKLYQGAALLTPDPITATAYTVSGLTPATQYTFTVQAVDTTGNESTDGPSLTLTTNAYDVTPPAWTNGSLTTADLCPQSVTLNWSGAWDNIGVTGYKVKLYQGSDASTLADETTVTDASCTLPLFSGTDNTIKVEALDANGNESSDGPQVTVTTPKLNPGSTYPIYTGRPMIYEGGLVIDLLNLKVPSGATMTVTEYTPDPVPGLQVAGKFIHAEFTGFEFKGAMKITSPLVEGVNPEKCTVYPLQGKWVTGIVPEVQGNNITGTAYYDYRFVKDFGVWEDTEAPLGYAFDTPSISSNQVRLDIKEPKAGADVYPDPAGIVSYNIYRDDFLLGHYDVSHESGNWWWYFGTPTYPGFYDTNVEPGHTYRYSAEVIDWFGNISARIPEISVYISTSDADTVATIKAMDLVTFAAGDSVDSVTQNLGRKQQPYPNATVSFASSNSAVLDPNGFYVTKPADADSADVTLTETITCGSVTDTRIYNLTIRWTETAPARTWDEFKIALDKSQVKNIVLTNAMMAGGTYDCKGKTLMANFSGEYIFWPDWQKGLNLGNFTFDGNGVSTISKFASVPDYLFINLDNINFQGMDNYGYIINAVENNTTQQYEVVLNNCQVSKTKQYAVFATASTLGTPGTGKKLTITNNTFASGANNRIEAGVVTITGNTFNSRLEAVAGATLNGVAITDAASAQTAAQAVLSANTFTGSDAKIVIYDTQNNILYDSAAVASAPSWPTGSTLTPSNIAQNGLTLTWSAATDNAGVTGYKVYQDGMELTTVDGDILTYDVTGLTADTQYTFTVQAGNAAGSWSTDGPSTTLSTLPSSAATVLTAGNVSGVAGDVITVPVDLTSTGEVTGMQFDLSYDQTQLIYQQASLGSLTSGFMVSANPVGDRLKVMIFSVSNTPIASGSGSVVQLQFKVSEGVQAGQTSTLGLSGVILSDAQGQPITATVNNGQFSVPQPADTAAPTWASGSSLTARNVTQSGLTLSWSAAADNTGVNGYKVYQDGTELATVDGNILTYSVTGLTVGTQYTFTVQAGDAAGNWSTDGPAATATTETAPVSDTAAPTWASGSSLTTSNVTQSGLTLSWSAAADNTGVNGYKVYQDGTELATVDGNILTYSVTGLTAGTQYTFTVQAGDAAGNWSSDGPAATVSTLSPPVGTAPVLTAGNASGGAGDVIQIPVTLTSSGEVAGLQFDLSYDHTQLVYQQTSAGSLASGFTVITNPVGDNLRVIIYNGSNTPVPSGSGTVAQLQFQVAAGVQAGQTSALGLSGVILSDAQGQSIAVTVNNGQFGVPQPADTMEPTWPSGSTLTAGNITQTGLTLTWTVATDNVGVTGFKVYQEGTEVAAVDGNTLTYNVAGLTAGAQYTFTVQAGDAAGNWSTDGPSVTVATSNAVTITDSSVTITDDGANKDLAVTADTPADVKITVPASVTDATVSVSALLNTPVAGTVTTTALPALDIAANTSVSADPVQVTIPAGATVSAPEGWNGAIHMPAVRSNGSVTVTPDTGKTATVNAVIEIGYGDVPLTFNKAVRILIPGQAGKDVGYSRGGVFTKITNVLTSDSQEAGDALISGGDGKIDAGDDLVIWTKHFTQFVTYTQTAVVSDTTAPSWSSGSLTTSSVSRTGLTLTWSGASDNVAVTGYNVYRGTTLLTASPVADTSYNVTGLSAGARYTFKVQAVDAAGNESADGPSVTVTTTSYSGGGSSSTSNTVNSTTGAAIVTPSKGGTISLGDEATVEIPANSLQGTSTVEVKIQKVDQPPEVSEGFKLVGSVYEFSVDGQDNYSFAKDVTLKFSFNPADLASGETPAVYYYDETAAKWVSLGGAVSGSTITVKVNHFTKFAVLAAVKQEEETTVAKDDIPGQETTLTLNDIAGHWAADNINKLVALGAINGYSDGSFKPDSNITRAEFATVLVKAFKLTPQSGKVFADTAGHWAKDYIATAVYYGIADGYDTDTFGPDDLITREQMAMMVVKAAKLPVGTDETTFADSADISWWARSVVATAVENDVIKGYPDNTFNPLGSATRAEAVTVIVNALK